MGGTESREKEGSGLTALLDPRLRLVTAVQLVAWPAVALGYFGLSYGSAEMEGNLFLTNAVLAAVELPGYLYILLLMDTWGRKPLFCLSLIFTGISSILSAYMTSPTARNLLLYVAKNTASGAFGLVFIYSSELFPTSVRGTGLGLCSLAARIGATATPFMSELAAVTSPATPPCNLQFAAGQTPTAANYL